MKSPATMVLGPVYALVKGKRVIVAEEQPLYMAAPVSPEISDAQLIAMAARRAVKPA
jgi:hypothetical protein